MQPSPLTLPGDFMSSLGMQLSEALCTEWLNLSKDEVAILLSVGDKRAFRLNSKAQSTICLLFPKLTFMISIYNESKHYYQGKSFCRTSFQLRMNLKKGQKQDRNERTQKDYPTSAKLHSKCIGQPSCILSCLPCFCPFFKSILN